MSHMMCHDHFIGTTTLIPKEPTEEKENFKIEQNGKKIKENQKNIKIEND